MNKIVVFSILKTLYMQNDFSSLCLAVKLFCDFSAKTQIA